MVARWVAGALVPLAWSIGSASSLAAESYQSQAGAVTLKRWVLYGIAAFAAGVGIAMLGYVARYWASSKGVIYQIAHLWIPLIAVACFVAGLVLPVLGGLDSLGTGPGQTQSIPKKR